VLTKAHGERTKDKEVEKGCLKKSFFSSGPVEIKILANGCTGKMFLL
jgi:hypothetical protein